MGALGHITLIFMAVQEVLMIKWPKQTTEANANGRFHFALERFDSPRHSSRAAQLFSVGGFERL
jgi:hypothetical protein